jgi:hypothetical protein
MQQELLNILKGMSARQILQAIAEAKTGSKEVYRNYVLGITKRETREQLEWFIAMAEEGKESSR